MIRVSMNYSFNFGLFWLSCRLNSGSEYSVSVMLVMFSLLVCLFSRLKDSVMVSVGDSDMMGKIR